MEIANKEKEIPLTTTVLGVHHCVLMSLVTQRGVR